MRNLIFSYNYTYHCLRLSLLNSDTLKLRLDIYDQRVSVCRDQIASEGHKRRQRNSKGYRDSETQGGETHTHGCGDQKAIESDTEDQKMQYIT